MMNPIRFIAAWLIGAKPQEPNLSGWTFHNVRGRCMARRAQKGRQGGIMFSRPTEAEAIAHAKQIEGIK